MTIQDVYLQFLTKVNRNNKSNGLTADKQRFVLLYNENQIKRILQVISEGNDERIREIQMFLKPDTKLALDSKAKDRVLYLLPEDYLDFSSSYALAEKKQCKNQTINLIEIKDKNYTQVLSDNFNKPSFDYREAPFVISDNKFNVFTADDFTYSDVVITYYRYPKEVDIAGYLNLEGKASKDINPEGDKKFIDRVTSMAALDYSRNYQDIQGIQIAKDRVQTNN